jgi:mannose-6-phosphate isomerase-like protein (cupin superfamily)
MRHLAIVPETGFEILGGTSRSQAATMVLAPGSSTGGPDNQHASSDQWLYVMAGQGEAIVNGDRVVLRPGSLLLIEAEEAHEITNTGQHPLETLNIYAPPEY